MFNLTRKAYRVTIDKPCEENWNSMITNENGKFCLHCSKNVIDLSSLTDQQLIKVLKQSSGKICGRLQPEQLNRVLTPEKESPHISIFSKIAAGFLLVGTTENVPASPSALVEIVAGSKTDANQPEIIETNEKLSSGNDSLKNVLQGRIVDKETNEELPGVTVSIGNTSMGTSTDMNGYFRLLIPENKIKDSVNIIISCLGYTTQRMSILKEELSLIKEIALQPEKAKLQGEIIIIEKPSLPHRIWWKTKGFFSSI